LTIDILCPGESMRDSKFPKLQSSPTSYFLNVALRANQYNWPKARFAFEFYVISFDSRGTKMESSRYIDDHYTPGIRLLIKRRKKEKKGLIKHCSIMIDLVFESQAYLMYGNWIQSKICIQHRCSGSLSSISMKIDRSNRIHWCTSIRWEMMLCYSQLLIKAYSRLFSSSHMYQHLIYHLANPMTVEHCSLDDYSIASWIRSMKLFFPRLFH
jgi:Lysosomal transcription factor, NCU-G1